ncbi:5-formyltetrahydrofolate cyclo-ligase [Persicimonas caeni]|uniref:5-formyltetrahydrofolate cyclo-ligase n=1 Tax=Persicimonas caeni TaxID=2292766 RepID=A0A4Y6PYQ7_PERCE|nr:5-formyltetrahydrofolate cyclo-ligase [Persicimonas caeni]QDG53370.1 5-formyltetrahydrofolate cyclo-ligase [Persicimonas caeni]QED34591.1 5-formyltetrahydrofolate cyclo-ligase [Persicimonas caeni]
MAEQLPSAKNKAELRTAVLKKRDELTSRVAETHSRDLCERLDAITQLEAFSAIAGYAPIRNEIDATAYLARRQEQGARLYFPRVTGPSSLCFVPVDSLDELEPGSFGVPEPQGEPASVEELELFLVPGVAFDKQGRRLGFGRGFYDRALARALSARKRNQTSKLTPPVLVGVCYHWQLIEGEIPVEPHDISMDVIATDEETIWCSRDRLT